MLCRETVYAWPPVQHLSFADSFNSFSPLSFLHPMPLHFSYLSSPSILTWILTGALGLLVQSSSWTAVRYFARFSVFMAVNKCIVWACWGYVCAWVCASISDKKRIHQFKILSWTIGLDTTFFPKARVRNYFILLRVFFRNRQQLVIMTLPQHL